MTNEQKVFIKSYGLLCLNFILCLSVSILLHSGKLFGLILIDDLPKTSLRFYTKKNLNYAGKLSKRQTKQTKPAKVQEVLGTDELELALRK